MCQIHRGCLFEKFWRAGFGRIDLTLKLVFVLKEAENFAWRSSHDSKVRCRIGYLNFLHKQIMELRVQSSDFVSPNKTLGLLNLISTEI